MGLSASLAAYAERNLPRYTSYPTALAFEAVDGASGPTEWMSRTRGEDAISAYVHIPFCRRLCWYCGCHTTIAHDYDRVDVFQAKLGREVDILAERLGPHAGLAHLHFGGGSPNALSPQHFSALVSQIGRRFALRKGAEIAVELDPGLLSAAFIDALAEAGVTRVSLGVQTFDPEVQARVNRIQPFDAVARSVERLRRVGVKGINFDLMYGLPGQTPEGVRETVRQASQLEPDRVAMFGYAHVPWMKKHQVMIKEAELADTSGRWDQADAADVALMEEGFVRIGLDHYARPNDRLALAAREGRLRRNFQGYTDDPAPVLVPLGPSAIGQFREGFVQNAVATDAWSAAIAEGRTPLARMLPTTTDDQLRASVIERLMCDLTVDVGSICGAHGVDPASLDACLDRVLALESDGLCHVEGRVVTVPEASRRLVRVTAACFDARLPEATARHSRAV